MDDEAPERKLWFICNWINTNGLGSHWWLNSNRLPLWIMRKVQSNDMLHAIKQSSFETTSDCMRTFVEIPLQRHVSLKLFIHCCHISNPLSHLERIYEIAIKPRYITRLKFSPAVDFVKAIYLNMSSGNAWWMSCRRQTKVQTGHDGDSNGRWAWLN